MSIDSPVLYDLGDDVSLRVYGCRDRYGPEGSLFLIDQYRLLGFDVPYFLINLPGREDCLVLKVQQLLLFPGSDKSGKGL